VEMVRVSFDGEIEPPVASYSSLPDVSRLVVLLGMQTGMSEILHEELCLLIECLLHLKWRIAILLQKARREKQFHFSSVRLADLLVLRLCRWSDSIISSAVSNGP